jgi:hypothetical protein
VLTIIYQKIRALIKDFSKSSFDTFDYTNSNIFTIAQSNITITTVLINGNALASGESYSYSSTTGKITITRAAWTVGDSIEVDFTYTDYSDTELKEYVRAALEWISIFSEDSNDSTDYEIETTEIYPTPPNKTQDLICIIASFLIEPNISEKRIGNVVIKYPKNKSIRDQIKELIQQVNIGIGILDLLEFD